VRPLRVFVCQRDYSIYLDASTSANHAVYIDRDVCQSIYLDVPRCLLNCSVSVNVLYIKMPLHLPMILHIYAGIYNSPYLAAPMHVWSSVGIAMCYGLNGPGFDSWQCTIYLTIGHRSHSFQVKRPGREADHSHLSVKVKNGGAVPQLPHVLMA
jgi:hypothetical protein